jgi:hypothetical protein
MISATTLFTSLLTISSALALPSTLAPRQCGYSYQPQLWYISQHEPEASSGPDTTPFTVWQDIGKKDLVASFRTIPGSAWGCNLQFAYNPNHNAIVDAEVGDPTVINVYQVSDGGNFPWPITWDNTNSRTGSLIGTWHFPTGDALNTSEVIEINGLVCSPVLTYRFSVASDSARGGVSMDTDAVTGLRMSYNC